MDAFLGYTCLCAPGYAGLNCQTCMSSINDLMEESFWRLAFRAVNIYMKCANVHPLKEFCILLTQATFFFNPDSKKVSTT